MLGSLAGVGKSTDTEGKPYPSSYPTRLPRSVVEAEIQHNYNYLVLQHAGSYKA